MAELSWKDIDAPDKAFGLICKGEEPWLYWPAEDCPVTVGDRVTLVEKRMRDGEFVTQVGIIITALSSKWSKGKEVRASYDIEDNRQLYVAATNVHIDGKEYTHAPHLALDAEAGPVLDPEEIQQQIAVEIVDARKKRAERRAEKAAADPKKRVRGMKDELNAALPKLSPNGQITLLAGIQRLIDEAVEVSDA